MRVENDANATALAEWKFGAGKGTRNFVFLTMGTGIGGGLILDGKLYRGTNDLAGEIGHQTILMNGPLCGCGKRGCLEALASGPAIARLARESMLYGRHKRVLALAGGKPADITAAHVVEAAKEGDAFARQILEEAGTYMGVGIANVIQMLNPERIALGTIAVHAGDLILKPIRSRRRGVRLEAQRRRLRDRPGRARRPGAGPGRHRALGGRLTRQLAQRLTSSHPASLHHNRRSSIVTSMISGFPVLNLMPVRVGHRGLSMLIWATAASAPSNTMFSVS